MKPLLMALLLAAAPALAQAPQHPVKIGVLTDMGGTGADDTGAGSVMAARMAIEDYGGKALGQPIGFTSADHQAKAEIGSAIARRWFGEDGVDAIADLTISSVALAVQEVAKNAGKVALISGAATKDLVGKNCSPMGVQWAFNTYAYANASVQALAAQGHKKWFFLTSDYAFGKSLEADGIAALERAGGTVAGSAHFPLNTSDFSSFLLQARSSGADVLAFAHAGSDFTNSAKQATEFGLNDGSIALVPLTLEIRESQALGPAVLHGVNFVSTFYWNDDDGTRAFSQRFFARMHAMPSEVQAQTYSAVLHYLRAVDKAGTTDGLAVVTAMKALPVNDFFVHDGHIRPDGYLLHDYYAYRFKTAAESTGPWDVWQRTGVVPAASIAPPSTGCTLPGVSP
jgi:branched-chain amino acid transport system substrate-binding protein